MTKHLRVLMVAQRFPPYHFAGAELQALALSRALQRRGHAVSVLTTRFRGDQPLGDQRVEGVPVFRVATVSGALLKPTQLLSMASHVVARARGVDIVHGHALSSATLGALAAALAVKRPVVLKQSLGGAEGDLARVRGSRAARPLLELMRRADAFIALRSCIADELVAAGMPAQRIHLLANGVDLTRFCPPDTREERVRERAQLGLPAGPLALFVGQLVARKGIASLLRAWRSLQRHEPDAWLVVVGKGTDEELVTRAAADGARLRFVGLRADVPRLMRVADVLVLPSRNEGCPNVALEALASGLPLVVGRHTLPADLTLAVDCGRVVDDLGDDVELGRALAAQLARARALDEGEEAAWRDALARRRASVAQLDIDLVAQRYEALYRQLLQR